MCRYAVNAVSSCVRGMGCDREGKGMMFVDKEGVYKVVHFAENGIDRSSIFPAMSSAGTMKQTTLETTFGSFVGVEENEVRKFLGIKYALVKNWLSAPEIVTSYGNEVVDATRYG